MVPIANVTITVPDALVPRLTAALRAAYPQHQALTDVQAFKAVTADFWRAVLSEHEQREAERTAQALNTAAIKAAADKVATDAAAIG